MGLYQSTLKKPEVRTQNTIEAPEAEDKMPNFGDWLKATSFKALKGLTGGLEQEGRGIEVTGERMATESPTDLFSPGKAFKERFETETKAPDIQESMTEEERRKFETRGEIFEPVDKVLDKGLNIASKGVQPFGKMIKEGYQSINEALDDKKEGWIHKFYRQPTTDEDGKMRWGYVLRPDVASQYVFEMIGQMSPALGAAYLTGSSTPVAVYMGGVELGSSYDDFSRSFAEQEGVSVEELSEENKQKAFEQAFLYAGISAYLEKLPFDAVMKTGIRPTRSFVQRAIKEVPMDMLKQAVKEGGTEAAQQFTQNAIAKYGGSDPDRDLMQGVAESAYAGAVTGMAFGVIPSITSERATPQQQQAIDNVQQTKQQYEQNLRDKKAGDLFKKGEEIAEIQRTLAQDDAVMFEKYKTDGAEIMKDGKLKQEVVQQRLNDVSQKLESTAGKDGKRIAKYVESMVKPQDFNSYNEFTAAVEKSLIEALPPMEAKNFYEVLQKEMKEPTTLDTKTPAEVADISVEQAKIEGDTVHNMIIDNISKNGEVNLKQTTAPIETIQYDTGFQDADFGTDPQSTNALAQVKAGEIKPIVVKLVDGQLQVQDGNHTLWALKQIGKDVAEVIVAEPDFNEAAPLFTQRETVEVVPGREQVASPQVEQRVKGLATELQQEGEALQQTEAQIARGETPTVAQGVATAQNIIPREGMRYVYKEAQRQGVADTLGKGMSKVLTENELTGLKPAQQAVLRMGLESVAANEGMTEGAIVQNIQALGGTAPVVSQVPQAEPAMASREETQAEVTETQRPRPAKIEVKRLNELDRTIRTEPTPEARQERTDVRKDIISKLQEDAEVFVGVKGGKNKADVFSLSIKKLPNGKHGFAIAMNTPYNSRVVDYNGKFATADKARRMGVQRAIRMVEAARQAGVPTAGLSKIRSALMAANKKLGQKALPAQKIKKVAQETRQQVAERKAKKAKELAERDRAERKPGKKEIQEYQKHIEKFDHMELPEMVNVVKELTGKAPFLKRFRERQAGVVGGMFMPASARIAINPSIVANEQAVSQTMAHEIGHLVDFLPDRTMNRGTLLGRVLTLRDFMKKSFGDLKDQTMRDELWELSQDWRPIGQNPSPSFLKYRKSSPELYADAISVMLNDPDLLQRTAPTFYKNFFKYLDRKPEVKQAFFDTWEIINKGEEALLSKRQETIYEMFDKGEQVFKIKREEKDESKYSMAFKLKTELMDRNQIMIDKVNKAKAEGKNVSDETNPIYFLEEYNYMAGKIKAFVETEVQPILATLQENDMTWENFGELMLLERAANERGKMANPGGFNKRTAEDQIEFLRNKLGNEKFGILKTQLRKFRNSTDVILVEAEKSGLYTPEMMDTIKANESYATFQVVDYLEDYVPASIKKQVGTYSDIANPGTSTVMKMVSIIRATETNNAKNSMVKFLKEHEPNEIREADTVYDGRIHKAIDPKEKGQGLFTVMEEGKVVGYYMDSYMVDIFDKNATQTNSQFFIPVLRTINQKLTRPLLIQYNPGFMGFNLARDFWRFWKNIPEMGFIETFQRYKGAVKPAMARVLGKFDPLINEMEKNGVLSITYNEIVTGQDTLDAQIDTVIEKSGVTQMTPKKRNKMLAPFMEILDFIDKTGQVIETLPKVAGYQYLKDSNVFSEKEMRSFVRTSIGSPDFFRRGSGYGWTNEVFLFSNAIKEAIRADVSVMKNPTTRNGYWMKSLTSTFAPKMLMLAAAGGLLGEPLKELFKNISEYDKTNYICVPLGVDKNGKTMYLRIPMDETGRFLGGMLWKTMTFGKDEKEIGTSVLQLLSYTGGQLPSISPVLDTMVASGQYFQGKNPYDFFRGRSIIPDREFQAGGMESFKPFLLWSFQNMGANVLLNFNVLEKTPGDKTFGEKTLELPVVSNFFGRWMRISDYGEIEEARAINEKVQKENSRRLIKWEKEINKAVKEYKDGDSGLGRRSQIENKLVRDILGNNPDSRQAGYIKSKFQKTISRGYSDTKTRAVMSAYTNDAKISVLKKYKEQLSAVEFKQFLRDLEEQGIISGTVYNEF